MNIKSQRLVFNVVLSMSAVATLACIWLLIQSRHGKNAAILNDWRKFSADAKTDSLKANRSVVVFVHNTQNPESQLAFDNIDASQISTLVGGREYVPMILKYSSWDDADVKMIKKDVNWFSKSPFLVVYPNQGSPFVVDPYKFQPISDTSSIGEIKGEEEKGAF